MSDRRLTFANDRVVHAALATEYPSLKPASSELYYVAQPVADLCRAPDGSRDRQLRYGDAFEGIEHRDGWVFGMSGEASPYAGWIRDDALKPEADRAAPTVMVISRQTHAYTEPDFKSPERLALPHLSQLSALGENGRFTQTELGWVPTSHLSNTPRTDPVAVAALYVGTPYLWGGNSAFGIDCSGLVQAGLLACGLSCPGDSDLQEAALGETLPPGTPHQRGDLLFWKGHVAWVSDPATLLHANAHHMATTFEPLEEAIARIEAQGDGPVTRHARLLSSCG